VNISARRERFLRQQLFATANRVDNREAFRREVIQTASPLRRALVAGGGIVVGILALVFFIDGAAWWAALLAAGAILLVYTGLRGRPRSVDTILRGLDASLSSNILDWLFPG
jgi:hypothetical protein